MFTRERLALLVGLALTMLVLLVGILLARFVPRFLPLPRPKVASSSPTAAPSPLPSTAPSVGFTPSPITPTKEPRKTPTYRGSNPATPKICEVKVDGGKIYGINLCDAPLTVRLVFTNTYNVKAKPPLPLVALLNPREKRVLSQVSGLDPYDEWRFNYEWNYTFGSFKAKHDTNWLYALPYQVDTSHRLSDAQEHVYVFDMPENTPVHCARSGKVVYVEQRYDERHSSPDEAALRTNRVVVRHDDGTLGFYDNLRPQGAAVAVNEWVATGKLLGYSGQTGYCAGPQLRFAVIRGVDGTSAEAFPLRFLTEELEEPSALTVGQRWTASEP